jgi:hypothetical protein
MKRFHNTGLIVLDWIDIICFSFFVGSVAAHIYKQYKKIKKNRLKDPLLLVSEDPLVSELKHKSSTLMLSEKGKLLKLPLIRGGEILPKNFSMYSILFKNKSFLDLLKAILLAEQTKKRLVLLQYFFIMFEKVLSKTFRLSFALDASLDCVKVLMLAFPSSLAGFLIGAATAYSFVPTLLPLIILYARGIEEIVDPTSKCRIFCKAAEELHNKELKIEMKKLISSLVENTSAGVKTPLDAIDVTHVICVEEPLSIVQRHKLREVVESTQARKRVQHFSEFIKKFPECGVIPSNLMPEEIRRKITE